MNKLTKLTDLKSVLQRLKDGIKDVHNQLNRDE